METRNHPPHELGRRGEWYAGEYLVHRGWTILERNYRFGRREVDLVIARGAVVAFVEVKTRVGARYGGGAAAVDWRKRREIEAVACEYLTRRGVGDRRVRFDVLSVEVGPGWDVRRIDHIEDAWRVGWP